MDYPSIPQALLQALDHFHRPRLLWRRQANQWEAISSAEFLERVAAFAQALRQMGVARGDRVAIFSGNRPEWHIADFAVLGIGGITVPVYFRESAERALAILADSGARILVAAGEEQIALAERLRGHCAGLAHVIVAGSRERHTEFLDFQTLISAGSASAVNEYRASVGAVSPQDLATIIYTSGATGEPKGVMLSHANLTSNALETFRTFHFDDSDLALSFLPLAHVYERTLDYGYFFRGVAIAYLEKPEELQQALLDVRPTIMAAVPRVFEKIHAALANQGETLAGPRKWLFRWALSTARQCIPWKAHRRRPALLRRAQWAVADHLVYARIREAIGGRLRCFTSGSAPLEKHLAEFFWSIGIPVYEGYGLTETSPVVTANVPVQFRVGTAGRPISGVQVAIASDGEILVAGSCVMRGYYGNPDETRAAITPDGFLRTGDLGSLDSAGFLTVTGRKKELIKTAGGKFVAPQPLESRLKTSPYIANAIVTGDRRKFISALIVPNFASLREWARERGRSLDTQDAIAADAAVRRLIGDEISRLTSAFAHFEQPRRFALLNSEFTFDSGELTYTMKLRRGVIEQKYAAVIERMYADEDAADSSARVAGRGDSVQQGRE